MKTHPEDITFESTTLSSMERLVLCNEALSRSYDEARARIAALEDVIRVIKMNLRAQSRETAAFVPSVERYYDFAMSRLFKETGNN